MFRNFSKVFSLLAFAGFAFAQTNTLSQTTLSAAALATDSVLYLTSVSAVNYYSLPAATVASELYVIAPGQPRGEVMIALSAVGTNGVKVRRGEAGARTAFPSGSTVIIGQPNWFYNYDPSGGCTTASTFVTPWVNTKTGFQWLCSTVTNTWVPGFGNDIANPAPTAAVASAAGSITPSGPLFHITGTAAITGFTLPVGFTGGGFCAIPDGIFTTTTANNIALGSTGVVKKVLCWTYDPGTALFYPSY